MNNQDPCQGKDACGEGNRETHDHDWDGGENCSKDGDQRKDHGHQTQSESERHADEKKANHRQDTIHQADQ